MVLMDTHRRATTDDSDPFFVSVFTRESVVLADTRRELMTNDSVFLCLLSRREATTDDSDRFSVSVFTQESVVLTDTCREATTGDSDRFSVSPVSQRSND